MQDNVEEMPGAMMLVGNKVDLEESSEREVSTETGETFAKVSCLEWEHNYSVVCSPLSLVQNTT